MHRRPCAMTTHNSVRWRFCFDFRIRQISTILVLLLSTTSRRRLDRWHTCAPEWAIEIESVYIIKDADRAEDDHFFFLLGLRRLRAPAQRWRSMWKHNTWMIDRLIVPSWLELTVTLADQPEETENWLFLFLNPFIGFCLVCTVRFNHRVNNCAILKFTLQTTV